MSLNLGWRSFETVAKQRNELPAGKEGKGSDGAGPVVRLGEHPFLSYMLLFYEREGFECLTATSL
jgi:hypothetical protein